MELNCFNDPFSGPTGIFSDGRKISIRDTDQALQYWSDKGFQCHAKSTINSPIQHLEIAEKVLIAEKSGTQWVVEKFIESATK